MKNLMLVWETVDSDAWPLASRGVARPASWNSSSLEAVQGVGIWSGSGRLDDYICTAVERNILLNVHFWLWLGLWVFGLS